ncbi:(-)-germacrene D synthase, partial [Tanacetum coccineum]
HAKAVPKNLPYVRDRLVEVYFWIVGVYFKPEYSRARVILTKMIAMANVVDNTYDAYGTYEELQIFNQVVQRWSMTCLEALPGYMKPIYKGLVDIHNEMEDILANDEKSHYINYAREAMKEFVGSQMQEAEWRKTGYVPTVEEHKSVSFVSCGYMMLTISSFIGMDETTTDEPFQWVLANPPFVKAACAICRIMDDIVGHKLLVSARNDNSLRLQLRFHYAFLRTLITKPWSLKLTPYGLRVMAETINLKVTIILDSLESVQVSLYDLEGINFSLIGFELLTSVLKGKDGIWSVGGWEGGGRNQGG